MKNKAIIILLLCLMALSTSILYAQNEDKLDIYDSQESIMDKFNDLLQKEEGLERILNFIGNNISLISEEKASQLINEFEDFQKNYLSRIEEKFYNNDLQMRIYKIYQNGFDLNKINDINEINKILDQELKELLIETRNSGYKVETAEGMFFPIIDYQFYKQFTSYQGV